MKGFFKALIYFSFSLIVIFNTTAEGSKNLIPNNGDRGYLQHDDGGNSNNFLKSNGVAEDRLYVYVKDGERLYYGLRRIVTNTGGDHGDLTILLYDSDNNLVSSQTILRDQASTNDATFQSPQDGVIDSKAEALAGPRAVVGGAGYRALSYLNNTGTDQAFYIVFDQGAPGANRKSWYDIWDFSVYDNNEEKPGRLYCKAWSFTGAGDNNALSNDFQLYAAVPSIIGGADAGYFIKEIDVSGIQPFGMLIYANSTGTDGTQGDTNGDGDINFLDERMSQENNSARLEFDLFVNNPDIELYPTSILPSITISDANFYCNSAGNGGEGTIFFNANQEGYISIIIDLNGTNGYQPNTSDVIIETQINSGGNQVVRWDGLDGNDNPVPNGTDMTISGRFTSGPVHVPLYDVENNNAGITMLDVRPSTSFNLIYWDDSGIIGGTIPVVTELDGTNTSQHIWSGSNEDLFNTWSFGYYQISTQNIAFNYLCDPDGDGIDASVDLDSDNDGITDANEGVGDFNLDTDGDNIPDYLDVDIAGFVDSNGDGVNDQYDTDLDGIPDGLDLDSDNDGIPDMVENGLVDTDLDGTVDNGSGIADVNANGLDDNYDDACTSGTPPANVTGNATSQTNNSVGTPGNATGVTDANRAELNATTDWLILDMGGVIPSGAQITINSRIRSNANHSNHQIGIRQSLTGVNGDGINLEQFTYSARGVDQNNNYLLASDARYIHITLEVDGGNQSIQVDGIEYSYTPIDPNYCGGVIGTALTPIDTDGDGVDNFLDLDSDNDGIVDVTEAGGTAGTDGRISGFNDADGDGLNDNQQIIALTRPDTDGDGIRNYLDIDSDNDGLTDNIESQLSSSFISPTTTDANGNGLLDIYDPNNGGTLLSPVNTDGDANPDYMDTDADNDGVFDFIEGWDANKDGFSDLDTNNSGTLDDTDACGAFSSPGLLRTENADFENGLKGLTSFSGDVQVTNNAQSGDAAIVVGPAAGGTIISNFIPIDAGVTLTLTGQAFITGAVDYTAIGITYWDATKTTRLAEPQQVISQTGTYGAFTVANATAPAGTAFVEVWSSKAGATGTLNFDNFSLINTATCAGVYTTDTDGDGLYDIYEPYNAPRQNTDNAGESDWQDNDDDNDGALTSGEDINGNNNWADDFTQGGVVIPDYLFKGDVDGDAIAEEDDLDSDNDGILDATEANGEATNPSEDADGDGILNYQDAGISSTLSDASDVNGDGVFDIYDTDLDGIPDFLDLDSDNDGIWDAIEANNGSVPFGLNQTTGRFELQDPDNDGLMNYIDTDDVSAGGISSLANPDSDGDGIRDYLDIDSDGDGIIDNIESQTTASYVALSGVDSDSDGIDDSYDPTSGGVRINPVNSDGLDLQDYLDSDSDNDNVPDNIEGHDANFDGIADATSSGTDTDGDGLDDAYDTDNGGTAAALQNTDGIDFKDWRDDNDDNDSALTINEDINNNGNYADDQTNGQLGSIPDYLYNGDKDNDGIADALDLDSDNDGILDTDEDGGESVNPSLDADGDGIPNFKDADLAGLSSNTDINGDGIFDVYDKDLDGIPDFQDLDSDNDGIPDIVELGGVDADGNGIADNLTDTDNDGLVDLFDSDNSGTLLTLFDTDGDGLINAVDLDSDNDGITDITEAGGTDTNGDGKVDSSTDSDYDGLADLVDTDSGGTAYVSIDTDNDGVQDYLDVDSDNDGITDAVENGAPDTNNDGRIDSFSIDTDNDGLADAVDPDNGGTSISLADTDNDGILDFRDLDSDNDGYPDILEGGGVDSNGDGIVDALLDSDGDGIPDVADVSQTGGSDADGDGIDNVADVDFTGGNDTDGDGIDNNFDPDIDGDGFDDTTEANPYSLIDKDADGNLGFRDLDSDNDGIVDVIEFGQSADPATGTIAGFLDSNNNGWNDTQESTPITPPDSDGDGIRDFNDIDSDNDGIVDNYEAQTKATYVGLSGTDSNQNGLDDVYDPNAGGTLITPVNTDAATVADYLDTDADNDGVVDNIEGDNATKSLYAGWDTGNNNDITDETGYNLDSDEDGLWDVFDNVASSGNNNVTGSSSAVQDTDKDGLWDFQDVDDDNDGFLTSAESTTAIADPNGVIPDYLFGNPDSDGDGINDNVDLDSDNDGLADVNEAGNSGVDPSGDIDGDGLMNFEDSDMDGDGLANTADTDADGNSVTDTWSKADSNGDGVLDVFDKDKDGIPNFRDRDSDNDGIADVIELGLTDANEDGTLDEGSGITDVNTNGHDDRYETGTVIETFAALISSSGTVTSPANAVGGDDDAVATLGANGTIVLDFGVLIDQGSTVTLNMYRDSNNGSVGYTIDYSTDNATWTNFTTDTGLTAQGTTNTVNVTLSASAARYVRVIRASGNRNIAFDYGFVSLLALDSDGDGIANLYDLDSDDDGITDNVEGQPSGSFVAAQIGDADSDGILNVYDETFAIGNAIAPQNTDGTDNPDYLDLDSDNDSVSDLIEGWDGDSNGFASWDTDGDNDATDEAGYNNDNDADGIKYLFDSFNGLGNINNINGSNQSLQDTDSDAIPDFRDINDDGDNNNTIDEDNNSNANFADDFTQGGGAIPDYLYRPDADLDGIDNNVDLDADNDGILNTDEYDGATYATAGDGPFDDDDADGLYNYLDADATNFTDANNDGVDDRVDKDRDGVPNFFDLDSDNDGILDAIEANDGLLPIIGGFDQNTGRFSGTDSGPADGLVDVLAGTPLAKGNLDGDALDDYLDIDSDNDGLTDNVEGPTTANYAVPTGIDTDGDGIDDRYDPDNGGTVIIPTNTDGTDEPDYRDTDSDNDTNTAFIVGDIIEGYDANRNGFSDLDTDLDGLLSDQNGYNIDTDNDGLWNLFDTFSGRGVNNIVGTRANLQDTDGDGILDFRDTDDDADAITTAVEDVNGDGNWTNDKVQGGGATPDYLYFNDSDNDRIADGQDADGDNDGIPDSNEYDNTVYRNPFGDQDADGVFNFNDSDNPTDLSSNPLTDTNSDGIWDEYDWDLDGVPNFFDLDSDNDGIPDIIEAGGVDTDNDGKVDGTTDSDGDGIFDNVDVDSAPGNGGSGVDTDGDDIDDTFDVDLTGGTDADGDSIDDDYDLDTDGDGVINTIDPDEGGTALENGDFDNDGLKNVFDYDADNDGILDIIEAGGADFDGNGILDAFGDTDGDGWGNSRDSDNGGTAFTYPNTDGTGGANYLDIDSEGDGNYDWNEGFDDNEDLSHISDYAARIAAYNSTTSSTNYSTADGNANSIPDYLDDADGDNWPNLLDPDNATYYLDTDQDGIINLFDIDQNGNFYGNVSGVPDNDEDNVANVLDLTDIPLPLNFLAFTGRFEDGKVKLEWSTSDEINVSHFEILHGYQSKDLEAVGTVKANNVEGKHTYQFEHNSVINGYHYYQIKEIDYDDHTSYTQIILVEINASNISWSVYPNPTSRLLHIETNVELTGFTLKVVDMTGRALKVYTYSEPRNTVEIDVSDWNVGLYQLILETPSGQKVIRVMKN
ncbi:MAG: T9SS type A sorting domain-containing protein [Cyclobacteriaceae bacterium]